MTAVERFSDRLAYHGEGPAWASTAFHGGSAVRCFAPDENLPDAEQPEAGSVFRARPGVTGLPVVAFAG